MNAVARFADIDLPDSVQFGGALREPLRRLPTGIGVLDALLAGGLPRGRVSELVGQRSAGKTSTLLGMMAAAVARGEVVAHVDVAATLSLESCGRAGIDLHQFLWVRPPSLRQGLSSTELLLQTKGFGLIVLDLGEEIPPSFQAHVWPRLARAAENSQTVLLLLAPKRVAASASALGIAVRTRSARWRHGHWPLFDGFGCTLSLVRNKLSGSTGEVRIEVLDPLLQRNNLALGCEVEGAAGVAPVAVEDVDARHQETG